MTFEAASLLILVTTMVLGVILLSGFGGLLSFVMLVRQKPVITMRRAAIS